MARPERNNVDYFPFICNEGKKMYYLEETYGNDGFATFVKILRELAKTNYHYLDLSNTKTLMFLSAKCKVSKENLELIINDLVELDKFDSVLWNENKIIWCQDFIDSIQDAYIKRKNDCITYQGLLQLLQSLGVRKQSKCQSIGPVNTQSKEEYNKEEQTNSNLSESSIKTIDFICKKFGITETNHFLNYQRVYNCVVMQYNFGDEKFRHFKNQCYNYFIYKELSQEKKHSFKGFIGTPEEKYFDGGWNSENWIKKHTDLKAKEAGIESTVYPSEENKTKKYPGKIKESSEPDLLKTITNHKK